MKKHYKVTFQFDFYKNLRPHGMQEIILELSDNNYIQEAFVELYNRYGDDVDGISKIECID